MEIEHFVLATIAWGTFALFLVGAMVGTILIERTYRTALAVFVVATGSGFIFSFLAGFTIGQYTAVLPLIVTAFAVTRYRDPRLQLAALAPAIGGYVLLAWLLAAHVHFCGLQLVLPFSLVASAAG